MLFVKVFQLPVLHVHEQGKLGRLSKQGFLSSRSHPVLKINFCAERMHIEVVILKKNSSLCFSSWLLMAVLEILNYLLGRGRGGQGGRQWMGRQSIEHLLEGLPRLVL